MPYRLYECIAKTPHKEVITIKEGKAMKEGKMMSLKEIFLIVITAAILLAGNWVLASSGEYACFYEAGMNANATICQHLS